ncbi:hypothetical protein MRX96_045130 [Rhipicephalus microplus]
MSGGVHLTRAPAADDAGRLAREERGAGRSAKASFGGRSLSASSTGVAGPRLTATVRQHGRRERDRRALCTRGTNYRVSDRARPSVPSSRKLDALTNDGCRCSRIKGFLFAQPSRACSLAGPPRRLWEEAPTTPRRAVAPRRRELAGGNSTLRDDFFICSCSSHP